LAGEDGEEEGEEGEEQGIGRWPSEPGHKLKLLVLMCMALGGALLMLIC